VRTRRGDPGAAAVFDEALELAVRTGTLQRLAPVHAARAEAAWLEGGASAARIEAEGIWELALAHRHAWHVGESAFWQQKAGAAVRLPSWAARPFALQVQGRWAEAASAWASHGCPYEEARALAEGDDAARVAALALFDRLGARPAAEALRRRMRGEGAAHVPRGPRAATRGNTFGLTNRQAEILGLISEGLSNAGIAKRLCISAKTVDHHVCAILAKLDVPSRHEAARLAASSGTTETLLRKPGEATRQR
jgi:DNA-binding CsgD family transcriptional regulator